MGAGRNVYGGAHRMRKQGARFRVNQWFTHRGESLRDSAALLLLCFAELRARQSRSGERELRVGRRRRESGGGMIGTNVRQSAVRSGRQSAGDAELTRLLAQQFPNFARCCRVQASVYELAVLRHRLRPTFLTGIVTATALGTSALRAPAFGHSQHFELEPITRALDRFTAKAAAAHVQILLLADEQHASNGQAATHAQRCAPVRIFPRPGATSALVRIADSRGELAAFFSGAGHFSARRR